jgi:predicted nucleic acid-binding protein
LIYYLDTSLLVASLSVEVKTNPVQTWLAAQAPSVLAISDWVVSELSAALSIKLRTAQITLPQRSHMLAAFAQLSGESLVIWSVSGAQFRDAANFADQYTLGLRAGDAMHLAIAADRGATLCTLDRRLAEAGQALGVDTMLL